MTTASLPKGWTEVALGDVCAVTMGQAPAGESYNEAGNGLPLIAGAGDFGPLHPQPKKFTTAPSRVSEPGDVVLGIRATIGVKVLADDRYCLGRGVAGLRPGPHLDGRFLWNWLTANAAVLASKGRGATFLQVNRSDIAELPLRLPPMDEQRRIASALDLADELRAKRRAALALLDTLTESIFLDMFGSGRQTPVDIGDRLVDHAEGWRWELLSDVAELATGHTPDRNRPDYWNGGISWVNLNEIRSLDGRVATSTQFQVSAEGIRHSSAVVLPAGTVCFSRTASIGFVTVMGVPMSTSQDFVNWICGDRLDPTYLMHALLRSRERLRAISSGSTHRTIYMRIAEQFRVLVPPMELQQAFANRIERLTLSELKMGVSSEQLDSLFASLQQRAFRGEL